MNEGQTGRQVGSYASTFVAIYFLTTVYVRFKMYFLDSFEDGLFVKKEVKAVFDEENVRYLQFIYQSCILSSLWYYHWLTSLLESN